MTDPQESLLSRHAGSYVDPAGTAYDCGDYYLRGIRTGYAEFYAKLLEHPTIISMLGSDIVETTIESDTMEAYPLTLRHRKLSPLSYCYEWPAQMLRDAALLTLDICIRLVDDKMVLQDASPWNIVFDGSRPILVDFTSIIIEDPHLLWVAYDQFCRLFLYPILVASCRSRKVARRLLVDQIGGIDHADLRNLLPMNALLRMPWLLDRIYLPLLAVSIIGKIGKDKSLAEQTGRFSPSSLARRFFFSSLRRNIESIPLRVGKSFWSQYYTDIRSFTRPAAFDLKQSAIAGLLERYKPRTLVDIGCNRGGYSVLAANAGARVVAFDTDEDSIALLYKYARQENLPILPLVMDALNPSPACGWRAMEFPAAPMRLRSEMALALALVHHLAITQRQTFERIVATMADYAEKWLVTEFVPLDDPRSIELLETHRRDMGWYSFEGFVACLQTVFKKVESIPSHPKGRSLLLCIK